MGHFPPRGRARAHGVVTLEVERGELALQTTSNKRHAKSARLNHPIHDQTIFLTSADLKSLATDAGVRPWSFVQRLGDAVFIPAGCPHQVRNLRNCLKVAIDFVSPESMGECLSMAQQLRRCGLEDKLQGRAMAMHAARAADARVHGERRTFGEAHARAMKTADEEERAASEAAPSTAPAEEQWAEEGTNPQRQSRRRRRRRSRRRRKSSPRWPPRLPPPPPPRKRPKPQPPLPPRRRAAEAADGRRRRRRRRRVSRTTTTTTSQTCSWVSQRGAETRRRRVTGSVRRRRRTARLRRRSARSKKVEAVEPAAPAAPQFTLHGATAADADAEAAAAASAAALHPLLATNAAMVAPSTAVFAQLHREQAVAAQLQMQQINNYHQLKNYQMIQNLMGMYSQNQFAVPGMAPAAPQAPPAAPGSAGAKRWVRGESAVILQQSLRHHRGRDPAAGHRTRAARDPHDGGGVDTGDGEFTTLYVKNRRSGAATPDGARVAAERKHPKLHRRAQGAQPTTGSAPDGEILGVRPRDERADDRRREREREERRGGATRAARTPRRDDFVRRRKITSNASSSSISQSLPARRLHLPSRPFPLTG